MCQKFRRINKAVAQILGEPEQDERVLRVNANESFFIANELRDLDPRLFEVLYGTLEAANVIPMKTDIAPGAVTYSYVVLDKTGTAKRIVNYAEDLPRSDASKREVTVKFHNYGASCEWTVQDLRASQMRFGGAGIDTVRADAMARALAEKMDYVIHFGDSEVGLTGFANNADVPVISPITGNWTTATAAEIAEDLFYIERSIITSTLGIYKPNVLLLDIDSYGIVSTKPWGETPTETVLSFFLKNSQSIKKVMPMPRLATADVAGTGPRAIAGAFLPEVLEALVPIPFETIPIQERNLSFVLNGTCRLGGVAVRHPLAMGYMDGIGA